MDKKPKIYFTSKVFTVEKIGSNERITEEIRKSISQLWNELSLISEFRIFNGRFPTKKQIITDITTFKPNIIGCHLSHPITLEMLQSPEIFAIATSTAGFDHIEKTKDDNILITHTPGILHETVADYTIALIMANLRNLIDLHNYVWNGMWTPKSKWDLDQTLSSMINNKVLGIIGLGEIGKELVKKLYPWGIKILYYDITRMENFEKTYPLIEFKENIEDLIKESDIISLHIPLNKHTEKFVNAKFLKLMKKNAMLVNTARGSIIDFDALLDLLEKQEIQINVAFDVFPVEPIDSNLLHRLKRIKENNPEIRMILISHNASADANTRGRMIQMFLGDIIKIIKSSSLNDLKEVNLIPRHKDQLSKKNWRIFNYWKSKNKEL